MQILQFLKKQSPYNAGETAGFEDNVAERLIKAGVAMLARPKDEVSEEQARDVEHWKQKFYGLVPEHDKLVSAFDTLKKNFEDLEFNFGELTKERDVLKTHVGDVELERDKLLRQLNELEGLLTELRGANDSLATKDMPITELEGALAEATPAQSSAKPEGEGVADASNQETASGQETSTGKKAGRK